MDGFVQATALVNTGTRQFANKPSKYSSVPNSGYNTAADNACAIAMSEGSHGNALGEVGSGAKTNTKDTKKNKK